MTVTNADHVDKVTDYSNIGFETDTHYLRLGGSDMIDEDNRKLSATANFTCSVPAEDCDNHGSCNKDGTDCICNEGFLTWPHNQNEKCSYKQKKQSIAFALVLNFFIFCLLTPLLP